LNSILILFGWWASYIGDVKKVVFPKPWFKNVVYEEDICDLPGWEGVGVKCFAIIDKETTIDFKNISF
jgi:hypothetical protein